MKPYFSVEEFSTSRRALFLVVLVAVLFVGAGVYQSVASPKVPAAVDLDLETYVAVGELERPVAVTHAGDDRLFVAERAGTIRVVAAGGTVLDTPFLDIRDRVEWESHPERGLLGVTFHPDYANNGYLYVNYTAKPDGDTHISRFQVTADPNVADAGSEHQILFVDQPYANHNAGDLAFGEDGYLYIPLGDGGSGNDPENRAQNMELILGKMLRVDVDQQATGAPDCGTRQGGGAPGAYTVPADNPFVDGAGGSCDEIWTSGLRNPWRISFDRVAHHLYIGDVGQGAWEEVDFQLNDSPGGEDYGWSCYEGDHFNSNNNMPAGSCEPADQFVPPIFEFDHSGNCSVIGGYVYRGIEYPALYGRYLLTDHCSGTFWDLVRDENGTWQSTRHENLQRSGYSSFGEDAEGELYVTNLSNGALYRVVENSVITPTIVPNNRSLLPIIGEEW